MDTQNARDVFYPELYQFVPGSHHDKKVIWILFDYDRDLILHLRTHTSARSSASQKKWYLTNNTHNRKLCKVDLDIVGKEVLAKISKTNLSLLNG